MTVGEWIWTVWYWSVFTGFLISSTLRFLLTHRSIAVLSWPGPVSIRIELSDELAALGKRVWWISLSFSLAVQVLLWPHLLLHALGRSLP